MKGYCGTHGALVDTRGTVKVHVQIRWQDYKNLKKSAEARDEFVGALLRRLVREFLESDGYND